MRNLLVLVGVALLGMGVYETTSTLSFTGRARVVAAKVLEVEERTGPPKPRQNTPVHVSFSLPNMPEQQAVTHLPLLQTLKAGDSLYLLVDPQNPQDVRLPMISELWALPLAYLASGIALLGGVMLLKGGLRKDWGVVEHK